MGWIDSIIERADQAQAAYEAKRKRHNDEIDFELRELDTIVNSDLRPGMPIAQAQRAIMLSQIRLLQKQWEAMRME
jgi:hypothetical protein